jgi:hypothetical protein
VPETLNYGTNSVNAPWNALLELLYVISRQSTNEIRLAGNWVPWNYQQDIRNTLAVAVGPLVTAPDSLFKSTHSLSENVLDTYTHQQGQHTLKAGVEIRRVVISNYYSWDGTISYAINERFCGQPCGFGRGFRPKSGGYRSEDRVFRVCSGRVEDSTEAHRQRRPSLRFLQRAQ